MGLMYFARSIGSPGVAIDPKVLNYQWEQLFNVSSRSNPDKIPQYAEAIVSDRFTCADRAASTFAALYRAGYIRAEVVSDMLQLCRMSVAKHGFSPAIFEELAAHNRKKDCIVLVAGCQNDAVLRRRVSAAVDLSQTISQPFDLIFSGRFSATGAIRHQSESTIMEILYKEMIQERSLKRSDITIRRTRQETNATRTVENLDNVLGDESLMNRKRRHCLVVVSSTFHLIRIAAALDERIKDDRFGLSGFVSDVCLVGAEDPHEKHAYPTDDWPSIKALMFELYLAHMN